MGDEFDTQLGGMIDGVAEGEERIRAKRDTGHLAHELGLLGLGDGFGDHGKLLLPLGTFDGGESTLDEANAGVHAVLLLDALGELHVHDLGVHAQGPGAKLAAGELDAIDARLLTGTDTNHHTVLGVADGIGLGVLDADGREDKIADGLFCTINIKRKRYEQRKNELRFIFKFVKRKTKNVKLKRKIRNFVKRKIRKT